MLFSFFVECPSWIVCHVTCMLVWRELMGEGNGKKAVWRDCLWIVITVLLHQESRATGGSVFSFNTLLREGVKCYLLMDVGFLFSTCVNYFNLRMGILRLVLPKHLSSPLSTILPFHSAQMTVFGTNTLCFWSLIPTLHIIASKFNENADFK